MACMTSSLVMKPTTSTTSIFSQPTKSFLPNTTCFSIQSKPIKPLLISCSAVSQFPFSLSAIGKKTHFPFFIKALLQEEYEENLDDQEWAQGDEEEEEEVFVDAEEEWVPSEDCKVYVGNLPYDVGSEQLAGMFQEAGVVERAEVFFLAFLGKVLIFIYGLDLLDSCFV